MKTVIKPETHTLSPIVALRHAIPSNTIEPGLWTVIEEISYEIPGSRPFPSDRFNSGVPWLAGFNGLTY